MKQITELQHLASLDLIELFQSLGYLDGAVESNEIKESNKITFWNQFLDNADAQKKSTYIVYTFQQVDVKISADNETIMQNMPINIDLFTTLDNESEQSYNIRKKLEEALVEKEWNIDFMVKYYDDKVKLWHYTYLIGKLYG